jgi:hypothetical protein
MSDQTARRLAWGLFALGVMLFGAVVAFALAGWGGCADKWTEASEVARRGCEILREADELGGAAEGLAFMAVGLVFSFLGAVLASRVKGNALGWIFIGAGLLFVGNAFANAYVLHAATEDPGSLPAAPYAGIISEVLGGPIVFVVFAFFFLLFPTGQPLSPRWRVFVWAGGAAAVVQTLILALHPGPFRLAPLIDNPLGVAAVSERFREVVDTVTAIVVLVCVAAGAVSLVIRYRRSRGVERQQMKWFTTSAGFVAVTFLVAPLFWATPALEPFWGVLFILAIGSVPVAATLAILRYRLYDIDRLINRALVYGALTALAVVLYVGLVFGLQLVLDPVIGGSELVVAASTLAVAAALGPLRTRTQRFIDRRFYRRKYDASRIVDEMRLRLRDHVAIDAVETDILAAVRDTVQPAHVSLWLRAGGTTP